MDCREIRDRAINNWRQISRLEEERNNAEQRICDLEERIIELENKLGRDDG